MHSIYTVLVQVVTASLLVGQSHSASFRCTEPSQRDLHAQWTAFASSETAFAHPSVYLLPEYRHHITPSTFDSQEFALDAPSGDACAVSDDIRSSVARRSLCAWYHVISSSDDRYPRDIVEAHRPDECGHRCGLSGGVCAELTFPVAVLRRTARCDEHGLYVYEGAWHDMVVGFTCTAAPEATADRYPRDIVEAHRPDECGHRCGLSGGVCAELTFPVAVLRRTARCDEHGLYVYEGAWHDMVVGFTCTAAPEATSFA
ncbi:hypothetical protein CAPTEDRAFT_209751 [Capitella teleta]|uniref:Uncharacterized protein n=1 Tax=Capitella teleta TaxID=283909 RepID=R7TRH3_CAPTE|nr:hypothetical protein CAPTEDRAFT_209751 [Capitella teleta]|eukprot:ELT96239.1 hypothetical protein CAPTEDRAFT_209751 [Capitella teleta]